MLNYEQKYIMAFAASSTGTVRVFDRCKPDYGGYNPSLSERSKVFQTMQEFIFLAFVMLLVLSAYWSLVIFPRQRDFSKRQQFVRTLVEGDEVITAGGIIGRVLDIRGDEGIAYVELADGVVVRVITASLLQPFDPEELKRNVQMAMREEEQASASE
jgi:preprotein translocase subunit YajC